MNAMPELVKVGPEWRSPEGAPVPYRIFHFELPGLAGGWYLEIDGAPFTDPARRRYMVSLTGVGTTVQESPARFASRRAAIDMLAAELERRSAPDPALED